MTSWIYHSDIALIQQQLWLILNAVPETCVPYCLAVACSSFHQIRICNSLSVSLSNSRQPCLSPYVDGVPRWCFNSQTRVRGRSSWTTRGHVVVDVVAAGPGTGRCDGRSHGFFYTVPSFSLRCAGRSAAVVTVSWRISLWDLLQHVFVQQFVCDCRVICVTLRQCIIGHQCFATYRGTGNQCISIMQEVE